MCTAHGPLTMYIYNYLIKWDIFVLLWTEICIWGEKDFNYVF